MKVPLSVCLFVFPAMMRQFEGLKLIKRKGKKKNNNT